MKVRVYDQPTAKQKKALKKQCVVEFHNLLESYNRQVALQIMYILHFNYGFGKKRLESFFNELKKMQESHITRYEVKDDDVPDICEIKLRESGINIEDFFE